MPIQTLSATLKSQDVVKDSHVIRWACFCKANKISFLDRDEYLGTFSNWITNEIAEFDNIPQIVEDTEETKEERRIQRINRWLRDKYEVPSSYIRTIQQIILIKDTLTEYSKYERDSHLTKQDIEKNKSQLQRNIRIYGWDLIHVLEATTEEGVFYSSNLKDRKKLMRKYKDAKIELIKMRIGDYNLIPKSHRIDSVKSLKVENYEL